MRIELELELGPDRCVRMTADHVDHSAKNVVQEMVETLANAVPQVAAPPGVDQRAQAVLEDLFNKLHSRVQDLEQLTGINDVDPERRASAKSLWDQVGTALRSSASNNERLKDLREPDLDALAKRIAGELGEEWQAEVKAIGERIAALEQDAEPCPGPESGGSCGTMFGDIRRGAVWCSNEGCPWHKRHAEESEWTDEELRARPEYEQGKSGQDGTYYPEHSIQLAAWKLGQEEIDGDRAEEPG